MIKIVRDTRVPTKAVELDNFDLKSFYRLFLDGYDCPYYYNSYGPESLIFDTSGIHPSRGLEELFEKLNNCSPVVRYDYTYVQSITKYLKDSLSLLDYSKDCKAILEVILTCENSEFFEDFLPAKLAINYNRAILLIMHQLKLKVVDNIDANRIRLCNYLINATFKKDGHRTYKLKDDITINIEYNRVFTDKNTDDCFTTVPTEMLAVKNRFKLVNLYWNECSLFENSELALATNVLGVPNDTLHINVWYKREKCFYFKFTPFK